MEGASERCHADPAGHRDVERGGSPRHGNARDPVEIPPHQGAQPLAFGSGHEHYGKTRKGVGVEDIHLAATIESDPPVAALAEAAESTSEVGHAQKRQVLHGSGGRLDQCWRQIRRGIAWHHDRGKPHRFGRPQDGTDVARVGHLVQGEQQRVAVRIEPFERERGRSIPGGDHPLVDHALSQGIQLLARHLARGQTRTTRCVFKIGRQPPTEQQFAYRLRTAAKEGTHRVGTGGDITTRTFAPRAIYTRPTAR